MTSLRKVTLEEFADGNILLIISRNTSANSCLRKYLVGIYRNMSQNDRIRMSKHTSQHFKTYHWEKSRAEKINQNSRKDPYCKHDHSRDLETSLYENVKTFSYFTTFLPSLLAQQHPCRPDITSNMHVVSCSAVFDLKGIRQNKYL